MGQKISRYCLSFFILSMILFVLSNQCWAYTPLELEEIQANQNPTSQETLQKRDLTTRNITCPSGTGASWVLYSNDFESDDGGWSVTSPANFWEWGVVTDGIEGCDSSDSPHPTGSNSGTNAWATNLDGCYPNAGATSILSRNFDLTSLSPGTPVQLEWWHWYHVFYSFDTAEVYVNDDLVWEATDSVHHDWSLQTVDLTPYAGSNITVEFQLYATTVVNRSGWYLDDLEISYCRDEPIPTLSEWGVIIMSILLACSSIFMYRRKWNS